MDKFVGAWNLEAIFPQGSPIEGSHGARASFEWTLGGAFLVEHSEVDHPDAPDGFKVVAPSGDGYTQHHFDSRGVARIYHMTFDGRV